MVAFSAKKVIVLVVKMGTTTTSSSGPLVQKSHCPMLPLLTVSVEEEQRTGKLRMVS